MRGQAPGPPGPRTPSLLQVAALSAHGQLPTSLSDDAKIMSTLARPTALTRTWMALTVSPLSGPLIGICSFRTSDTTPTVTLVF